MITENKLIRIKLFANVLGLKLNDVGSDKAVLM